MLVILGLLFSLKTSSKHFRTLGIQKIPLYRPVKFFSETYLFFKKKKSTNQNTGGLFAHNILWGEHHIYFFNKSYLKDTQIFSKNHFGPLKLHQAQSHFIHEEGTLKENIKQ